MAIRIDTSSRAVDLFGAGKDGFKDQAALGTYPTRLNAKFFNHSQEEPNRTIEAAGYPIVGGTTYTQLLGSMQYADIIRAMTSSSALTSPGSQTLFAVAGSDDSWPSGVMRIAVGASGSIYTADAAGNTGAPSAASSYANSFFAAVYAGATFGYVIGGQNREIQTSPNAATWTRRSTGSGDINGLAYSSPLDMVIAVGNNTGTDIILSSVAPATFTSRSSALTGGLYGVVWAETPAMFIAYGAGGIQTSVDGITWSSVSALNITKLCWNESLGVAIARRSNGTFYRSTDLVTWTSTGLSASIGTIYVMVPFCGGVLIYGSSGISIMKFSNSSLTGASIGAVAGFERSSIDLRDIVYDSNARVLHLCGDVGFVGMAPMPFGV